MIVSYSITTFRCVKDLEILDQSSQFFYFCHEGIFLKHRYSSRNNNLCRKKMGILLKVFLKDFSTLAYFHEKTKINVFSFGEMRLSFFSNFFNRYLFWGFKILFMDNSNTFATKKLMILIYEFIFAFLDRILRKFDLFDQGIDFYSFNPVSY